MPDRDAMLDNNMVVTEMATMGRRLVARLVDVVAVVTYVFALSIAHIFIHLQLWSDTVAPEPWGNWFLMTVTTVVVYAIYDIGFTTRTGATPGKDLMAIQVVDASTGGRPSLGQAFRRWLPHGLVQPIPMIWLAAIATGVLGATGLLSSRRQSLPDRLANTVVVDKAPPATAEEASIRRRSFMPRLVDPTAVFRLARNNVSLSRRRPDDDSHLL